MQYNDEVRFNLFFFHWSLTSVNSWTISIFYSKKEKVHSENETHGIESRKPISAAGMDGVMIFRPLIKYYTIPVNDNKGH